MIKLIGEIKQRASLYFDEIKNIRRHIHQNPELSFEEYNTSEFIQDKLTEWGIDFTSDWVKTGIVAEIKGKLPNSKTIALRADIDALPINEENDLPFKSMNEGVMHACGHDIHTASLLGVIRILSGMKDEFEGTIKFIFQPGEEQLPGGAKLMIEEGVLLDVSQIFGQHIFPDLEVGKVGFKKGMYMASTDEVYIKVKGKGGHAALPHQLVDPVVISANIIVGLQQIVSRKSSPYIPTVLSFGDIHGYGATNVIPDEVNIKGTLRTFNEEWRKEAHEQIVAISKGVAKSLGGDCEVEIKHGYPFLINDHKLTELGTQAAIEYLGQENVIELDQRMTAEDFAYYSQEIPGCFYRLGTANTSMNIGGNLHSSTLTSDERSIEVGMGLMSFIAIKALTGLML